MKPSGQPLGSTMEASIWIRKRRHRVTQTTPSDELKARIKRLGFEASQLKLDLHDLAEDLPNGWEQIMQVAARTHGKYVELAAAKQQLAELEKSAAG
jgi:hypothetical protein